MPCTSSPLDTVLAMTTLGLLVGFMPGESPVDQDAGWEGHIIATSHGHLIFFYANLFILGASYMKEPGSQVAAFPR